MNDTQNNTIKVVEYLDGFQYAGGVLQFFPHAEGYVAATQGTKTDSNGNFVYIFNYVNNYTDHLGNIRLSYTKDPVSGELEIMEENHYYPFGLKHAVFSDIKQKYELDEEEESLARPTYVYETEYQYKYNGKEWQDELGLNMYAMDMRMYDPAIARWVVQDPVTHYSMSPYNAFDNNPIFWADPSGADATSLINDIFKNSDPNKETLWVNNNDGTFSGSNGKSANCEECTAKDGPLKGTNLSKMLGKNFEGSEIVPWQGKHTIGNELGVNDFLERTEILAEEFDLMSELISTVGYAVNSLGITELKKLGIKGSIKSPTTRILLLTLIDAYLQQESDQMSETNRTLTTILRNYIKLTDSKSNVYEINILYNGYMGIDDYTQKSFYTNDGQFLGGWKRLSYKTEQQLPSVAK